MGEPREYDNGGKRFYVIDVWGFPIEPSIVFGNSGPKMVATYAVLDRFDMHREVATFTPTRGARGGAWCKRKAEELAAELNAEEETVAA